MAPGSPERGDDRRDGDHRVCLVSLESSHELRTIVADVRLDDGRPLKVIELAMPRAVEFAGDRLPASYANFYIGNRTVIVPTFDDPADEPNLQRLAACFRGREVVGINCRDLVLGLGTFHCLTQQVPARPDAAGPDADAT